MLNWYPDLTAGTYTGQTRPRGASPATGSYVALGGEFPW